MKAWLNHRFIYVALVAYAFLWFALHPAMAYLLDSDAVSYLTIAHRVANGDWLNSVNGLWSPLNSWLLVPFIKMGFDSWFVAKVWNFFFGGVVLIQAYYLFERLHFQKWIQTVFTSVLIFVICYFAYFQMFGDVLQLIFALAYVHLFVQKDFVLSKKKVILAALIMALGFYAKSYSLIFFVVHFTAICFLLWIKYKEKRSLIVANYILGVLISILVVLPWSFQMQKKYDEFSLTGFAGKLNISWYINSGRTFKDDIKLMIPPALDDSPSFWEDPYLSAGELSTPFSSFHHFKRWVMRFVHTTLVSLLCFSEISLFFIPIVFIYLYGLFRRKELDVLKLKLLLALFILPLGYLAMHIETRYVWLNTFLIIVLGIYLIHELEWSQTRKKVALFVFAASFLLSPLYYFTQLNGKNKELFELASTFKQNEISGKIVSNIHDEGSFWVVSYLSGLNNYTIEDGDFTLDQLIEEMKRYGIKYYWHTPSRNGDYTNEQEEFTENFDLVLQEGNELPALYKLKY